MKRETADVRRWRNRLAYACLPRLKPGPTVFRPSDIERLFSKSVVTENAIHFLNWIRRLSFPVNLSFRPESRCFYPDGAEKSRGDRDKLNS